MYINEVQTEVNQFKIYYLLLYLLLIS